jgi:acetate kinase
MTATVLALNSGSSSLKFGAYDVDGVSVRLLFGGEAEWQDMAGRLWLTGSAGAATDVATQQDAVVRIGSLLADRNISLSAVGHRIVHGGPGLRQHCIIDASAMQQLAGAADFAPLHVPAALSLIRYASEHFRTVPQVACFDTAFHAGLPDVARIFALPRELRANGVERFGFHGLSCESILKQLAQIPERLVIAHLGSGASVTAVKNGRSVDTSMGLTPTGGVVMGTRCGDIDPGVLIFLLRRHGYDPAQLEEVVDRRSGLLGISGESSDMRKLHAAARDNPDAALAIEIFCYSVRKQIAAMAAVLNGIDTLVFTGGIGEHDSVVRSSICDGIRFLGIGEILVLPSRENDQIALHARELTTRGETSSQRP